MMSATTYKEYISYTHWANSRVISWLEQLKEQQLTQPVVSSFGSIIDTVHHIISAEYGWVQRLVSQTAAWKQLSLTSNLADTINEWKVTMQIWIDYANTLTESELEKQIAFTRINGDSLTMAVKDIIMHCQNHSTQHRGQLITMLRQVGFTNITSLDLFTYYTNVI